MPREQEEISPDLVRRAQAGDEAASETLLSLSIGIIRTDRRLASRPKPAWYDLDDLAQEVAAKVPEWLPGLKPEKYCHWLRKVAINHLRDVVRRARRGPNVAALPMGSDQSTDPGNRADFKTPQGGIEARLEAWRLAETLGEERYRLLYLHHGVRVELEEAFSCAGIEKSEYYDRLKIAKCYALLAQARVEERYSDYSTAAQLCRRIPAELPRHKKNRETCEERFLIAAALTKLADVRQAQGIVAGPEGAIELYHRAGRMWVDLHDQQNALYTLHSTALCYEIEERWAEALTILREVAERRRGQPRERGGLGNAYRNMASVLVRAGAYADARTAIERALPLLRDNPTSPYQAAVRIQGEVRLAEGRRVQALDLIERARAAVPSHFALFHTQAEIALCQAWLSAKQWGGAWASARRARWLAVSHGFSHEIQRLDQALARYGVGPETP